MVPRIGKQGSSFKGAALYYLHDKGAATAERVAFTITENLPTDNAEIAWRLMAYTALNAKKLKQQAGIKRSGRPSQKPVWTVSLSWHPTQTPDRQQMVAAMRAALAKLGLAEHQVLMAAHRDEPHPHIHAIVNLVNPATGKTATVPYSKEKLSKWAQQYEEEQGKIYCEQRVENNARRDRESAGRKSGTKPDKASYPRHKDPALQRRIELTQLYRAADSGKAFRSALREAGYALALGRRLVVIDPAGQLHSLARQLDGIKAKDLRAKLKTLALPSIGEARKEWMADKRKAVRLAIPMHEASDLQTKHAEEQARFHKYRSKARQTLADELSQQYGDRELEWRRDIADLEKRSEARGITKTWRKLRGTEKQEAAELAAKRKSLENLEWRKTEATEALESRLIKQEEKMQARQRRDWHHLEDRAQRKKPDSEAQEEAKRAALIEKISKRSRNIKGGREEEIDYEL